MTNWHSHSSLSLPSGASSLYTIWTGMSTPLAKKFFIQKVLTGRIKGAIMTIVKQGRTTKMANWYENAENHEEDCEELMELIEFLATNNTEGF